MLIDSGDGERLERWGERTLRRPDPSVTWAWREAAPVAVDARFDGQTWRTRPGLTPAWRMRFDGLQWHLSLGATRQVGLFPEQAENWAWLRARAAARPGLSVLNLFAYTGGATLALARAGASVCHVDASRAAVQTARDNARLNGLDAAPVRWIVDDVGRFVDRERRRGRRYDAVVLDPPAFGRGAGGEVWRLERDLPELLYRCAGLLSEAPAFVLLNAYVAGVAEATYANWLRAAMPSGMIQVMALFLEESGANARALPTGFALRWQPG